jgi:DNA-binding MarR family transcriptional regulator
MSILTADGELSLNLPKRETSPSPKPFAQKPVFSSWDGLVTGAIDAASFDPKQLLVVKPPVLSKTTGQFFGKLRYVFPSAPLTIHVDSIYTRGLKKRENDQYDRYQMTLFLSEEGTSFYQSLAEYVGQQLYPDDPVKAGSIGTQLFGDSLGFLRTTPPTYVEPFFRGLEFYDADGKLQVITRDQVGRFFPPHYAFRVSVILQPYYMVTPDETATRLMYTIKAIKKLETYTTPNFNLSDTKVFSSLPIHPQPIDLPCPI